MNLYVERALCLCVGCSYRERDARSDSCPTSPRKPRALPLPTKERSRLWRGRSTAMRRHRFQSGARNSSTFDSRTVQRHGGPSLPWTPIGREDDAALTGGSRLPLGSCMEGEKKERSRGGLQAPVRERCSRRYAENPRRHVDFRLACRNSHDTHEAK